MRLSLAQIARTSWSNVVRKWFVEKSSPIEIAKFHSVSFDETTDSAHKTQMTFLVRLVDWTVIREHFLAFNDPHDLNRRRHKDSVSGPTLTGDVIGKSALRILDDLKLNPTLNIEMKLRFIVRVLQTFNSLVHFSFERYWIVQSNFHLWFWLKLLELTNHIFCATNQVR